MAFRAVRNQWRSLVANGNRSFATADSIHSDYPHKITRAIKAIKADFAPVAVVLGFVLVAGTIGLHTAKQQLVYSPSVKVNKRRRESVPEVDDPDHVVGGSKEFIDRSFLRKVAHTVSDPAGPNLYTRSREVESLKSVGAQKRGY